MVDAEQPGHSNHVNSLGRCNGPSRWMFLLMMSNLNLLRLLKLLTSMSSCSFRIHDKSNTIPFTTLLSEKVIQMMLRCGVAFTAAQCPRPVRRRWRPICSAEEDERLSNEQLRAQLDQLRAEAEDSRAKANTTRTRFLRLTDAAENLRKQATISITKGKESDARDLLFQKKKIMQALEKSKKRIELLDELSTKLHEAISLKESQLIGNVTLDLQVGAPDSPQVRIVSPKQDVINGLQKDERLFPTEIQATDDKTLLEVSMDHDATACFGSGEDLNQIRKPATLHEDFENEMVGDITGSTFFGELMTNVDEHLKKIEAELVSTLKVLSSKVDGSPRNIQMQQILELLKDIKHIRKRVLAAIQQHAQA